jgi:hypothetical protein
MYFGRIVLLSIGCLWIYVFIEWEQKDKLDPFIRLMYAVISLSYRESISGQLDLYMHLS